MLRNIVVLALVAIFLVTGSVVMAEGKSSCQGKNMLQCMYDWCADCGKTCAKTTECCCKACGKKCCNTCQTDCGGKCCAKCGK